MLLGCTPVLCGSRHASTLSAPLVQLPSALPLFPSATCKHFLSAHQPYHPCANTSPPTIKPVSPSPHCSRVALAVQLVRRPSLLLLDEPLAGLDWRTRAELISVLRALKSECTMVVVSHDLRELAPLVGGAGRGRAG